MKIEIVGWAKDMEDFSGRNQVDILFVVIDGKERAMGKADLIKVCKLNLPERNKDKKEAK